MTAPARTFTRKELLDCAERELSKRKHFYPTWVGRRKMTQERADREIELMAAIVETLARLVAIETKGGE